MSKRARGFTLTELLVVMGIIILFLAMAIPSIRSLTGAGSISMAQNELSAVLVHAREEAIAVQETRGVLFYLDSATDRVVCVLVQPSVIQDPNFGGIMLDVVPTQDSVTFPPGVRLQTIFSGTTASGAQNGTDDRYMGFNPVPASLTPPSGTTMVGGCFLFDGYGKLISRPYGYQMSAPIPGSPGLFQASQLCTLLNISYPPTTPNLSNNTNGSKAFIPGGQGTTLPAVFVRSQIALVLYDADAFKSEGFNDMDADFQGQGYTTAWSYPNGSQTEQAEEQWLDTHSAPITVNRFDGTLIKGE